MTINNQDMNSPIKLPDGPYGLNGFPFIVFEGMDGSGKSTQAEMLCTKLNELGFSARLLREPGGSELGERLRAIIKGSDYARVAELFLFLASRAELVNELLAKPYAGITIMDRWVASTEVYQRDVLRDIPGLPKDMLSQMIKVSTFGDRLLPSLEIFMDVVSGVARGRVGMRKGDTDRVPLGGYMCLRESYKEVYEQHRAEYGDRVVRVLDNGQTPEEIHETIMSLLPKKYRPENPDEGRIYI